MRQGWQDLRIAAAFLTILPVGRGLPTEPARLARSMALFPVAGLALGLLLAAADRALALLFPPAVVAVLLVLFLAAVTGGLHLDGLADLVDGLAGGKDREDALRIMKDSRVGAMGATALVMTLLLKVLALAGLPQAARLAGLLLMPAAGRWLQVVLAFFCPYARAEGGTGGAFVDQVGRRELLLATLTLAAAAVLLLRWQGGALLLLLALAAAALAAYFRSRLGGVTGDALGGATETGEVLTLLLVLALCRQTA